MSSAMANEPSEDLRKRRQTFANSRSLSQYAVSLPGQPEDLSGIHPQDANFKFFSKGREFQSQKAKHHYTADELSILGTYESADSLPSHTEVYRQWLEELTPRRPIEAWGIVTVVGLSIGVLTFILKECTEQLQILKNPFVGDYIDRGEVNRLWLYCTFMSCSLAGCSAIVCVYICPFAAGSGLPEIIGILNGVVVRNMLSFRTLFYKILSCLLTVSSGLPVGFEGPIVHIGAMCAASVARPVNPHCPCQSRPPPGTIPQAVSARARIGSETSKSGKKCCTSICHYRDCQDRHNLICMGAAAGVASAFSAPITGLLFAMEEMSSFWTSSLTWQTFVCCILSRSVTEILRSMVATILHPHIEGSTASLFEFTESALFDTKEILKLNLVIILPTCIIGVIGGFAGTLFICMHLKAARFRRKMLAKIQRSEFLSAIKVFEPMLVSLICSTILLGSLQFFECAPIEHDAEIYNAHEGKFLRFRHFQCDEPLNMTFHHDRVEQSGEYHEMATLVFGSWEQMIRNLFSRRTAFLFTAKSLGIILVFFFIFSSWGSLCFIASGLLIPQLAIGGLYGRLFGRLMCDIFDKVTLNETEREAWEWMDPGVFALLGSASFMSGTARLPITTVVMLVEMTNDINMSLLIMIVVMIAKFIGGLFTHSLYHSLLEFKCIPFLDDEITVYKHGRLINLELFKAADVMASPVICVNVNESLRVLSNLLLDTNHGAFPVVQTGFGFKRTFLGMITRLELTILLTKTVGFSYKEIGKDDMDRLRISYPEYSSSRLADANGANEILNNYAEHPQYESVKVNLLPYINTSSYSLPSQFSLLRTYSLFRMLGLRHLTITDSHNQVMGILSRKDLMGFSVDEKVKALLLKHKGRGRSMADFSPKAMLNCFVRCNTSQSDRDMNRMYIPAEPRFKMYEDNEGQASKDGDKSVPRFREREGHGPNSNSIIAPTGTSSSVLFVKPSKSNPDDSSGQGQV